MPEKGFNAATAKMMEMTSIGGFSLIALFFFYKIAILFFEFLFLLVTNAAGKIYPHDLILRARDNSAKIAESLIFPLNDFDEIIIVMAGIFFSLCLLIYLGLKTVIFAKKN